MIIQVRGTSGSGKSTVVRTVMERLGNWTPMFILGRRRPLYYLSQGIRSRVAVLGHYESPCGGCDTAGSARAIYELVQKVRKETEHILCEGLLLSEDVKWSSQLEGLRIIFLTTPLDTCLERIRGRRAAAGNGKELNPDNTANRVVVIERARNRLRDLGIIGVRRSCLQAPVTILKWLEEGG